MTLLISNDVITIGQLAAFCFDFIDLFTHAILPFYPRYYDVTNYFTHATLPIYPRYYHATMTSLTILPTLL